MKKVVRIILIYILICVCMRGTGNFISIVFALDCMNHAGIPYNALTRQLTADEQQRLEKTADARSKTIVSSIIPDIGPGTGVSVNITPEDKQQMEQFRAQMDNEYENALRKCGRDPVTLKLARE